MKNNKYCTHVASIMKSFVIVTVCCISYGFINAHAAYVDMGDGTVHDEDKSLYWQKTDDGLEKNKIVAELYCEELKLGGREDWVLPDSETLSTLVEVNYYPTINPLFQAQPSKYITSTILVSPGNALDLDGDGGISGGEAYCRLIDFSNGEIIDMPISAYDPIITGFTRCVAIGGKKTTKFLNPIFHLLLR
jgi:hypothetical protein